MDYDCLGDLITDSYRHILEFRPKEAIAQLKAGTLFKTIRDRAKAAQIQLYHAAETETDRVFLWSDLKWQTGLFPPEEPKVSEKAQKEAQQWLHAMGGPYKMMDEALKEANLAYRWNPEFPETWEEEQAEAEE